MRLTISRLLGIVPKDIKNVEAIRKGHPATAPPDPPSYDDHFRELERLASRAGSVAAVAGGIITKFTET